jgi:hypothetical protein
MSQKKATFIATDVRASNLTCHLYVRDQGLTQATDQREAGSLACFV